MAPAAAASRTKNYHQPGGVGLFGLITTGRTDMRSFLILALAAAAIATSMTVVTTDANAVVCAAGVYRAGCAGPRGAVVVRAPVAACRYVIVNGVRVRRCV
jgi:hypothetical protein